MIDEETLNIYRAALISQCRAAGGQTIIPVPPGTIPAGTLMSRWVEDGIELVFVPDGQAH